MKLETAYRKIGKHRRRWALAISITQGLSVQITAAYRGYPDIPESLKGFKYSDGYKHIEWGNGLANAMHAMASKLDRVELAIQKHNEAQAAIKKAGE